MNTRRLHYISGTIISLFIALHLFNHLMSVFGAKAHITLMRSFRLFYQNIFIESILLLLIIFQIISGIKLTLKKRKALNTVFDHIQIWSGLYITTFFFIHVSAVLTGRLYLHLDTNFYFGAAGINTFPYNLFFIPYYAFAIISVFGHLAAVHNTKMRCTILRMTPGTQSAVILLTGVLFTMLVFYGLTNHFKGVTIPKEYKVLVGGN